MRARKIGLITLTGYSNFHLFYFSSLLPLYPAENKVQTHSLNIVDLFSLLKNNSEDGSYSCNKLVSLKKAFGINTLKSVQQA